MWRVSSLSASSARVCCLAAHHPLQQLCLTTSLRGNCPTPPSINLTSTTPNNSTEPPRPKSSKYKFLLFAGLGLASASLWVAYDENSRVWLAETVPGSRPLFSTLGLSHSKTAPYSNSNKPSSNENEGVSVARVAEMSVAQVTGSKIPSHGSKKLQDAAEQSLSVAKQKSIENQQQNESEGLSVMQAAEDSARLLLSGSKRLSPEEKAEQARKKEETRLAKLREQEAETRRQQKEKEEQKAAKELKKQKKIKDAEQSLAMEQKNKAERNLELEQWLSRELSSAVDLTDEAIKANKVAAEISKEHANKLKEAMDYEKEEEAAKLWPSVRDLNDGRGHRVEAALCCTKHAEDKILSIIQMLEEAKVDSRTKDNSVLPSYKKQVERLSYELKNSVCTLKKADTVSQIMKHYYELFSKDKEDFKRELEAIVPEIRIGVTGLKLSEEELNSLLAHAHRRISQLKRQLLEQQLLENQRLQDALSEQRKSDEKEAAERIVRELRLQRIELEADNEAVLLAQKKQFETELKQQLARQSNQHQDHLQEALTSQQTRLQEQFDLALRERLIHERHIFIDTISKHLAQVGGLQSALEDRANLEKTISFAQNLLGSSLALMQAVMRDDEDNLTGLQITNIGAPLKRCQAAASDPFVDAVISTIPQRALEHGIYTVSSLERRFEQVCRECKKVALYPKSDNFLQQVASRVYAALMFWQIKPKYSHEEDFVSTDNMSTSDLLVQAQYFIENRCLASAVRCMVQIDGLPRVLAQDWIEEARTLLEVRQAAEALYAYASSRSMGTLF